jgi:hypothetical protein
MGALGAALLYILVSVFTETDVEIYRWRILGVALGAGAFEMLLTHYLPGLLWALLILFVEVILIALALVYWCGTVRKQALKVAGIFTGVRIALGIAIGIFSRAV